MNMQKKSGHLAIAVLIFFGATSALCDDRLSDILAYAEDLYDQGIGNNYLDHKFSDVKEIEDTFAADVLFEVTDADDLLDAVQECVYLATGVTGPYLPPAGWDAISELLATSLLNDDSDGLEFMIIDLPFALSHGGLLSAPCALGIIDGDEVLILQGQAA